MLKEDVCILFYKQLNIHVWLRDLAYNWKSEVPPTSEKIAEIGMFPQLKGGTTQSGESLFGKLVNTQLELDQTQLERDQERARADQAKLEVEQLKAQLQQRGINWEDMQNN